MRSADEVIAALAMIPHPEGGWYLETWRAAAPDGIRPAGSSIIYLLAGGDRSRWHRIDAAEVWQFSAGEPLELSVWAERDPSVVRHLLGDDVVAGQTVQVIVPAGAWQAARPLGRWTLVGCIVMPGFEFAGFELAPEGWEPPVG